MKKYAIILLVMVIALIAGCQNTPAQPTSSPAETTAQAIPAETQETTPPTESYEYAPVSLIAVSLPSVKDEAKAENGDVIFTYSRQNLTMNHPDQNAADKIIVDFLNRQDVYDQMAAGMHADAANASAESADWVAHQLDVHLNPQRIDRGVLSFSGVTTRYSGGIHPERTGISASYDMLTGDVLTLAGILTGGEKAADVAKLAVSALEAQRETGSLYEGFEDIVESAIKNDPAHNEAWYFTNTGLCFYFSPYEIAPYSSGIITVEIPYDQLTGLLYDGYFPVEQDASFGTIVLQDVAEAAMPYEKIANLILHENGKQFLITTDGLIQDLSVTVSESVVTQNDAPEMEHTYVAFLADAVGSDCAIMLQADIPSETTNLTLRYISGSETFLFRIVSDNGALRLEQISQ